MTLSTHTTIGALIGATIGNPILGFVIGFLSHLLVDMVPHGDANIRDDYHRRKSRKLGLAYVSIDGALAVLLLLIFFAVVNFESKFAFSAAVAGSVLPDLLVGVFEIFKLSWLKPFVKFHVFVHDFFVNRYRDVRLRYGILGQAIFILVIIHFLVAS